MQSNRWREELRTDVRDILNELFVEVGEDMLGRFGIESPLFLVDESVQSDLSMLVDQITGTEAFEDRIVAAMERAEPSTKDELSDLADKLDGIYRSGSQGFGRRAGSAAPRAVNSAMHHSARQAGSGVRSKRWVTVGDDKVRKSHNSASGQVRAATDAFTVGGQLLRFPGDPAGGITETVNCVPADTVSIADGIRTGYRRHYSGEMVRLETNAGHVLSITPNHPVLTPTGFKLPSELQEGDDIVCSGFGQGVGLGHPDVEWRPRKISEIVDALQATGIVRRVAGSPMDFHGDGLGGDINVVRPDRQLRDTGNAASGEPLNHWILALADLAERSRSGDGFAVQLVGAGLAAPAGDVGSNDLLTSSLTVHGRPLESLGLTSSPDVDAEFSEPTSDDRAGYPESLGEAIDRLSGEVIVCQLINVERYAFHGDVFNLETDSSMWGAAYHNDSAIVVGNCRCSVAYFVDDTLIAQRPFNQAPVPRTG